jgi:DNA-binding PadR family transcriptional regulator
MSLKLIILGLLMEGPKHPYAIQAEIRAREMDKYVPFLKGSLYYAVGKLAGAGLVRPIGTEDGEAGPERTVYAIEAAGADEFRRMIRTGFKAGPPYDRAWFAILPFMRHIEAGERRALIAAMSAAKRAQTERLRAALDANQGQVPAVGLLIGRDSLRRIELDIEFLDDAAALDAKGLLYAAQGDAAAAPAGAARRPRKKRRS